MSEKVIITVNEGKVRGIKKRTSFSVTDYYSFFGVPYGQHTGGALRFKDPVPVIPWKNILDATIEKKSGCLQFSQTHRCVMGSEECLYNNIHTPKIPSKGDPLKAVIVMIHPGGLNYGSPETWNNGSPDYVMHLDVVYVCVAFRLHLLGFLNLSLQECSGNQGLKDIILDLRWIKDNIGAFGGDPDNVTLLGSSIGAAIVHQIMLSPSAKGLFHKVILMGGYAFSVSRICKEENVTLARELAEAIGHKGTDNMDEKKLLSLYKRMSPEKFFQMGIQQNHNRNSGTPLPCSMFLPTVDLEKNGVLPLCHRKFIETTTRVPVLFGICEKEAYLGFCRGLKAAMQKNFFVSIRNNYFGWGRDITDDEIKYIKEQTEMFYCEDIMYSDVYQTLLDVIAKDLPLSVYVYKFTFEGNVYCLRENLARLIDEPVEGTFHNEDFSYWAKAANPWETEERELTPETLSMIHTFTQIIGKFVKTGNPNGEHLEVHWEPSTVENPCYMKVDKEMELIPGKLNGNRMDFWENLKKELKRE